jgi:hypothetical protein
VHELQHRRDCALETRLFSIGMSLAVSMCARLTTMRMLGLRQAQRTVLVEKIPDLANLAAGGLIFGQFVGGSGSL